MKPLPIVRNQAADQVASLISSDLFNWKIFTERRALSNYPLFLVKWRCESRQLSSLWNLLNWIICTTAADQVTKVMTGAVTFFGIHVWKYEVKYITKRMIKNKGTSKTASCNLCKAQTKRQVVPYWRIYVVANIFPKVVQKLKNFLKTQGKFPKNLIFWQIH